MNRAVVVTVNVLIRADPADKLPGMVRALMKPLVVTSKVCVVV